MNTESLSYTLLIGRILGAMGFIIVAYYALKKGLEFFEKGMGLASSSNQVQVGTPKYNVNISTGNVGSFILVTSLFWAFLAFKTFPHKLVSDNGRIEFVQAPVFESKPDFTMDSFESPSITQEEFSKMVESIRKGYHKSWSNWNHATTGTKTLDSVELDAAIRQVVWTYIIDQAIKEEDFRGMKKKNGPS